jgi:hypothetical protein
LTTKSKTLGFNQHFSFFFYKINPLGKYKALNTFCHTLGPLLQNQEPICNMPKMGCYHICQLIDLDFVEK